MLELYFVFNGHRRIFLGEFVDIQLAVEELKEHQATSSAINNPKFTKSMSGENIRIDYGARSCYYLICKKEIGNG